MVCSSQSRDQNVAQTHLMSTQEGSNHFFFFDRQATPHPVASLQGPLHCSVALRDVVQAPSKSGRDLAATPLLACQLTVIF